MWRITGFAMFEWNGALAQLGERLHGMQEVSGSIPLGSTISKFEGQRPATGPGTAVQH